MYTLIQFVCLILALIALGQSIQKEASKFDKIAYGVYCFIFIATAIFIQGVLKC